MTKSDLPLFALLAAASLAQSDGMVAWQQIGGVLSVDPGLKSVVGQSTLTPVTGDSAAQIQNGFLAHPLLVNNPPFVVSTLPDQSYLAGFAPIHLGLDTVFADFEGPLTYSVTATGTGTQASVTGNQLDLSGVGGVGITQLVVSATDGSTTIYDTFQVETKTSTGIVARRATVARSRELGVGVEKVFGMQAVGAARGELGTGGAIDDPQTLTVNLLLPAAGEIAVTIFDQLGTPVIAMDRIVAGFELGRLASFGDGRWVLPVTWNLRAANGTAVPTGVYLWKIEINTIDGQKLESVKRLGVRERK